ncbi:MAG: replicative DNA helicase, partial [Opitutaceae bacterium]|nr:replicative DNA helicase [Opitutaceae bacterium]
MAEENGPRGSRRFRNRDGDFTAGNSSDASGGVGRSLPHSIEAEEYLLSCCFLDGLEVVSRCLEARLSAGSFYVPAHRTIFEKLVELYNRQSLIDLAIVAEELKTTRQLDEIGGYAFLTQISGR